MLYGSVEGATRDMAKRGLPVTVITPPESLLEKIQHLTWSTSYVRRPGARRGVGRELDIREKLQAFRRQDPV